MMFKDQNREKGMRKIFITIFALFFLFSSLGFPGVIDYCNVMQKRIENPNKCCSFLEEEEHSCEGDIKEKKSEFCCNKDSVSETFPKNKYSPFSGDVIKCCETRLTFNHIDDSNLTNAIDYHFEILTNGSIYLTSKKNQVTEIIYYSISNPSLHNNPPLII